jgi:hypothetical protein
MAAPKKLSKPFVTISKIKTPHDLLSDHLPKRYTASLALSGSIADEIKAILDTLEIDTPHYSEIFHIKKGSQLIITNNKYTSQNRDLISGILNPIELTGIILNSILQYREVDNLLHMQKETTVSVKGDSSLTIFEIKPTGTRFNYKYRDVGSFIYETWLTMLSITLDPSTMLAHELSLSKHSRTFSPDQAKKPAPHKNVYTYTFQYKKVENIHVPTNLDLYVDSLRTLTLSASYRQIDRFILFDKREITYGLKNKKESNLLIEYQKYIFEIMQKEVETVGSLGKYTAKLKKAAVYARKAVDALNKGDTQTALNLLQTIIENYPGTPQAVEAQKLLSGLPNGL